MQYSTFIQFCYYYVSAINILTSYIIYLKSNATLFENISISICLGMRHLISCAEVDIFWFVVEDADNSCLDPKFLSASASHAAFKKNNNHPDSTQ